MKIRDDESWWTRVRMKVVLTFFASGEMSTRIYENVHKLMHSRPIVSTLKRFKFFRELMRVLREIEVN